MQQYSRPRLITRLRLSGLLLAATSLIAACGAPGTTAPGTTAPGATTSASVAPSGDKLAGSGEVVMFSYGGSYTEGLRKYVLDPFTKATGIKVIDVTGPDEITPAEAMFRAGRVDWDITHAYDNYSTWSADGRYEPIDYSLWDDESLQGIPESARLEDAVFGFTYTHVLSYDTRVFGNNGQKAPTSYADFWNTEEFPGPRGFPANPAELLPALHVILLADGMDPDDIIPLTDDKIDRALKKLDEIKPHVTKWFTAGGEPTELLLNEEVVLTGNYDGRVLTAVRDQSAPIQMVWEGGVTVPAYNVILKGGPNTENAQKLLAFLNRAEIAAGYTLGTGYSGGNANQLDYLPPDLVPLLYVNPENSSKTVILDAAAYAWAAETRPDGRTNKQYIDERFIEWQASQ